MRVIKNCLLLIALFASFSGALRANEFFAMDTIAKGPPEEVASLLRGLGYDGLAGQALDATTPAVLRQQGLKFYSGYLVIRALPEEPEVDEMLGAWFAAVRDCETAVWLAIDHPPPEIRQGKDGTSDSLDPRLVERLRRIADRAAAHRVSVSLYPHAGYAMDRFAQAIQLAQAVDRPNVGVTFNLCHWLKVEGAAEDPMPLIRAALPRLQFVTVSGADAGDTRNLQWDRLIQPLDAGTYDLEGFVKKLLSSGYRGPVGFQGYGIKLPPEEALQRGIVAWRKFAESR